MWHRKLSNQLHQTVLTINRQDNNICHVLQFCFFLSKNKEVKF